MDSFVRTQEFWKLTQGLVETLSDLLMIIKKIKLILILKLYCQHHPLTKLLGRWVWILKRQGKSHWLSQHEFESQMMTQRGVLVTQASNWYQQKCKNYTTKEKFRLLFVNTDLKILKINWQRKQKNVKNCFLKAHYGLIPVKMI